MPRRTEWNGSHVGGTSLRVAPRPWWDSKTRPIYETGAVKPVAADSERRVRACPRRHRLRSAESPLSDDPLTPSMPVRRTSSEPEAEGGSLLRLPDFRASLANQTKDTPNHLFGIAAARRRHEINYGERCPSP